MAYNEQLDKITQRELNPSLNDKIDQSYSHISNEDMHVSEEDRIAWDEAANIGTANGSEDGLMSKEDKIKLDGIDEYANNYVHPKSGVAVGTYNVVTVNEYGHVTSAANPTRMDITVTNSEQLNGQDADYYAPRRSPILLGVPQCPTADLTADNTQIANTTWVYDRITKFKDEEIILGIDFTGLCTCPAPAADANNTQIPNTQWVRNTINAILADYRPVIVGLPYIWHSDTLPSGALWCDGSSFDTARYPDLAKVYPNGKVPDYRGVVLRMRDRSKGYDNGRTLGSYQGDAIYMGNTTGRIRSRANCYYGKESVTPVMQGTGADGCFRVIQTGLRSEGNADDNRTEFIAQLNLAVGNTANETRMKNIAVNYIVFTSGFSVLEEASAVIPSYTITVTQPENGSIRLNGVVVTSSSYQSGDQIIIQAVANSGYSVSNLVVDGVNRSNPYTLTVSGAHKISAVFGTVSYTVSVTQPTGGSITLDGEVVNSKSVTNGQQVVVDIDLEDGYALSALYVNGNIVSPPYTVTINSSSVYISADVYSNTHIITVQQPSSGGFFSLNGNVVSSLTVDDGTEVVFDVSNVTSGYELDFISIDNVTYRTLPQTITVENDIYVYGQYRIRTGGGGSGEDKKETQLTTRITVGTDETRYGYSEESAFGSVSTSSIDGALVEFTSRNEGSQYETVLIVDNADDKIDVSGNSATATVNDVSLKLTKSSTSGTKITYSFADPSDSDMYDELVSANGSSISVNIVFS